MLSEDVLFKALKDNLSKVSRKYIGTIAENISMDKVLLEL